MTPFVIEKGIPAPPMPEYRRRAGRPPKHDWSLLEVGDSVLVESRAVVRTGYNFAQTHGRVFQAEKQATGARGWRVWRLA